MGIEYPKQLTDADFKGILALQQANLPKNISSLEAEDQGFVSVEHTLDLLKEQSEEYPHIIAKYDGLVVGYALVMLSKMAESIPMLTPMFKQVAEFRYNGNPITSYFIMGQICVAKDFRGKGIFSNLYKALANQMKPDFDFIITEIDAKNTRSRRAHQKVGFIELGRHELNGQDWIIVGWDISQTYNA